MAGWLAGWLAGGSPCAVASEISSATPRSKCNVVNSTLMHVQEQLWQLLLLLNQFFYRFFYFSFKPVEWFVHVFSKCSICCSAGVVIHACTLLFDFELKW